MTRSKDIDPRARLSEFARVTSDRAERDTVTIILRDAATGEKIDEVTEPKPTPLDWSKCSPEDRAYAANLATTLKPFGYDDIVLRPAFERFCLDHHDPQNWRRLVEILIEAHWSYPKDWTPERLHALLADSEALISIYPELAQPGKGAQLLKMIKELRTDNRFEKDVSIDVLRDKLNVARRLFGRLAAAKATGRRKKSDGGRKRLSSGPRMRLVRKRARKP